MIVNVDPHQRLEFGDDVFVGHHPRGVIEDILFLVRIHFEVVELLQIICIGIELIDIVHRVHAVRRPENVLILPAHHRVAVLDVEVFVLARTLAVRHLIEVRVVDRSHHIVQIRDAVHLVIVRRLHSGQLEDGRRQIHVRRHEVIGERLHSVLPEQWRVTLEIHDSSSLLVQ